jgi:hypothetical protein
MSGIESVNDLQSASCPTTLIDVLINIAERSRLTCVFPAQRSAWWRLDNCFRDQAVTNAAQMAGLLSGADLPVVPPGD